jgi:hypothetical protein
MPEGLPGLRGPVTREPDAQPVRAPRASPTSAAGPAIGRPAEPRPQQPAASRRRRYGRPRQRRLIEPLIARRAHDDADQRIAEALTCSLRGATRCAMRASGAVRAATVVCRRTQQSKPCDGAVRARRSTAADVPVSGPHRASTPGDSSTPPPQEPAGRSRLLPLQQLSHIVGNALLLLAGVSELRLDFLKQPDNPLVCRMLRALTGHRHLLSHLGWESSLRSGERPRGCCAQLLVQAAALRQKQQPAGRALQRYVTPGARSSGVERIVLHSAR